MAPGTGGGGLPTRATPKPRVSAAPGDGTALEVGTSVVARDPNHAGWYAGTVVGVSTACAGGAGQKKKKKNNNTLLEDDDEIPPRYYYRVVFVDGTLADSLDGATSVRPWSRPEERVWHKRRKVIEKSRGRVEATATQRAVEQLDVATKEAMARWPTARRAQEAVPWIPDPADIVACCRGQLPQAGGYRWRFAEPKPRVDAADVDELLSVDAAIAIQQTNPKRQPSKSHELYEKYKKATTVREMLALGGRRADVSYDVAHGWIKFKDPELARRFEAPGPKKPATSAVAGSASRATAPRPDAEPTADSSAPSDSREKNGRDAKARAPNQSSSSSSSSSGGRAAALRDAAAATAQPPRGALLAVDADAAAPTTGDGDEDDDDVSL